METIASTLPPADTLQNEEATARIRIWSENVVTIETRSLAPDLERAIKTGTAAALTVVAVTAVVNTNATGEGAKSVTGGRGRGVTTVTTGELPEIDRRQFPSFFMSAVLLFCCRIDLYRHLSFYLKAPSPLENKKV